MGKFRIVKQYITGSSSAPSWAKFEKMYIGASTGSLYDFDKESDAYWKMMQLSGSDSTKTRYKVIEI
tara:strand:- start:57 stop:257 length:201 start_codon:yes stop_codon:yes gene_type:complete